MVFKSLHVRNLLSFGPEAEPIELGPLNVLIGPNASGKSNFIEAISLLKAAPSDLLAPIRDGGIGSWLWKGEPSSSSVTARIDAVLQRPSGPALRHRVAFTEVRARLEMIDERIENAEAQAGHAKPYFYFGYENGRPMLNVVGQDKRELKREDIDPEQSILSQRKDPDLYPELSFLGSTYGDIRLYRNWHFGRTSPMRRPVATDLPSDRLAEDALNLALVLNRLSQAPNVYKVLLEALRDAYDGAQDIRFQVLGGTIQVILQEAQRMVPSTRLSDGTLRWLSLLTILLDPTPPPLVCIEEPELGLHPDLMHVLVRLLRDASQRMQIVITTHSENLVDALTDTPEVVLVCEKEAGSTTMRRLDRARLSEWLETYSLGELWRKGEIGGTRW
jgi:predicted ATPase